MNKKRVIKSYEKLDQVMRDQLDEKYPNGFTGHVIRLTNAQNETYFAIPLDTDEANYLIKVPLEAVKGKNVPDEEEDDFDNADDAADDTPADDDDADSSDPSYNQGFDDDIE